MASLQSVIEKSESMFKYKQLYEIALSLSKIESHLERRKQTAALVQIFAGLSRVFPDEQGLLGSLQAHRDINLKHINKYGLLREDSKKRPVKFISKDAERLEPQHIRDAKGCETCGTRHKNKKVVEPTKPTKKYIAKKQGITTSFETFFPKSERHVLDTFKNNSSAMREFCKLNDIPVRNTQDLDKLASLIFTFYKKLNKN